MFGSASFTHAGRSHPHIDFKTGSRRARGLTRTHAELELSYEALQVRAEFFRTQAVGFVRTRAA
eukprot:5650332-Prymnesium_polylepis.1